MTEGIMKTKDNEPKIEMTSQDVVKLYSDFENMGIKIWVDGGWSVDALLGRQIRHHNDLDIAVQWKDIPRLKEYLDANGYKELRVDSKCNFVVRDNGGREIDIHAFIYDDQGNIVDGVMYPATSLMGKGLIDGYSVRCLTPEYMVEALAQYINKHPHKYLQAVYELCKKFNIDLPEEYLNCKDK